MNNKIVLASQSPRRKQLLEWAEIDFEIIVRSTDETFPEHMVIEEVPVHIARNKAMAVLNDINEFASEPVTIIAADTIVVLENKIIGKPTDRENAINILMDLSGHMHRVITGVVIKKGNRETCFSDTTAVWFHELSQKEIAFYVDKYNPYDKAGAYAIQEWIGVVGIKRIEGDFYNVMGLPVSKVVQALKEINPE